MIQQSNPTSFSTDTYTSTPSAATAQPRLPANRKKLLGISAATVLLGGAVGLVVGGDKATKQDPSGQAVPGTQDQLVVNLPKDIDVAGKVSDSMPFDHAFSAARDEVGMGGVFSWHGHWYNTFEKEEWTGLSLAQRQDYTEMIVGEKLPVRAYAPPHTGASAATASVQETQPEPTVIEGYLNGQRVMGLDFDQDGIIDTLVMDGPDGNTYRVVDATGGDGLDTLYRYDSLEGTITGAIVLDEPFVLSNDDFSQSLESSMSKEVVDSILQPDTPTTTVTAVDMEQSDTDDTDDDGQDVPDINGHDDTYVNDGDVHDME